MVIVLSRPSLLSFHHRRGFDFNKGSGLFGQAGVFVLEGLAHQIKTQRLGRVALFAIQEEGPAMFDDGLAIGESHRSGNFAEFGRGVFDGHMRAGFARHALCVGVRQTIGASGQPKNMKVSFRSCHSRAK